MDVIFRIAIAIFSILFLIFAKNLTLWNLFKVLPN